MKLAILDPFHNIPGLVKLFPSADYYAYQPDRVFNYHWTNHMNRDDFFNHYGFKYRTDWTSITSDTYDFLIIAFVVYDITVHSIATKMMTLIVDNILKKNSFRKTVLFDTHDYDYDPTLFIPEYVDIFFKRNYSVGKIYSKKVFPFPLCMFVRRCILWSMIDYTDHPLIPANLSEKINEALWCGSIYVHRDTKEGIVRDRQSVYNQIRNHVHTQHFATPESMICAFRSYKICVDLFGVGNPNKRTVEILVSGSLRMHNFNDLDWGFSKEDSFHDMCFFSSEDEFVKKKTALLEDDELYNEALKVQETLVRKYFNKYNLTTYIKSKLDII